MSSNSASSPATRRRRAQIACRNCRKRKIKCVTNEEPPHNPCERCQRKGLACEYVAVGEPSPPSTPALEHAEHNRLPPNSQGYTYASHSHLPDSTYSMESSLHNQMTARYPTYPDMGSPNSSAHLNPLRFPSDHQSPWPVSNPNAGMLASQAGPTFDKSYYPPDYLASSGSNLSQWNHAHDPMRSNAFDTRLQYYPHVPNTQNTALYGSPQSYNSMHGCWCGQVPCTCGGRR